MMIIRFLSGLLLGILLIAFVAPYDPWVKQVVAQAFKKTFEKAMNCTADFELESFSVIMPSLVLKNMKVKGLDAAWQWQSLYYKTGFSWSHLIVHKSIDMWVSLSEFKLSSELDGTKLAVLNHLFRLINPPPMAFPLQLKRCEIRDGEIVISDTKKERSVCCLFYGSARRNNGAVILDFVIDKGTIISRKHTIARYCKGTIESAVRKEAGKLTADINLKVKGKLASMDGDTDATILYTWSDSKGSISLVTANKMIECKSSIQSVAEGYVIDGAIEGSLGQLYFACTGINPAWNARCISKIKGELGGTRPCLIQLILCDGVYQGYKIFSKVEMDGSLLGKSGSGTLILDAGSDRHCAGTFIYDYALGSGTVTLKNISTCSVPFFSQWVVQENKMSIVCEKKDTNIECSYAVLCKHIDSNNEEHSLEGVVHANSESIIIEGAVDNESHYYAHFEYNPGIALSSAWYQSAKGDRCEIERELTTNRYFTSLSLANFSSLMPDRWGFQAEGKIEGHLTYKQSQIEFLCSMKKGAIRLAHINNVIDNITANVMYNFAERRLNIHGLDLSLYAGSLMMRDGIIILDRSYEPSFMYIPCILNKCMIAVKRDIFAILSGRLLLMREHSNNMHLDGSIIIERCNIKENIFSLEFQRSLGIARNTYAVSNGDSSFDVDLHICSRSPIKIETPFIKACARPHILYTRKSGESTIEGNITLTNGSLQFPYKPLSIIRGSLVWNALYPFDPDIELYARALVRNTTIGLHVTGSLLHHHITFESRPPLSDEQIIGLLLAGSVDESLKNMIPALILNNISTLLFGFGSYQSDVMKKYFKPLGDDITINLIPSFTDQSGRGGIRGALEVTINDRWRAVIQKNFTLTEDTRFELEYQFADDILMRTVRDERKNVGFETEMRWKF